MALKSRIEKLESKQISTDKPRKVAMVFSQDGKTEAEVVAEWEVDNGPLGDDDMVVYIRGFEEADAEDD